MILNNLSARIQFVNNCIDDYNQYDAPIKVWVMMFEGYDTTFVQTLDHETQYQFCMF